LLKEGKVIVSFSLSPMTKDDLIILFNQNQKKYLKNVLSNIIPSPLASYIEKLTKSDQLSISSLNIQTINQIIQLITQFDVEIKRVEDVKRAFVNAGGIDTVALNPKTFESKSVKNLYFIGETVDVFGPIGGFNITIALSSGYASAQSVIKHYKKYH
jgi:predicted flavoprotein YhiN